MPLSRCMARRYRSLRPDAGAAEGGGGVDWADLEEMHTAGTLDADIVLGVLTRYLGGDDHRIERLRSIVNR